MAIDGAARFQLIVPDEALAPDVLGLWQAEPAPISFALGAEQPIALRWKVELPADRRAATAALEAQAVLLFRGRQTLTLEAMRRFEAAVGAAGQTTSFAAGVPQAERDLAAWMRAMGGDRSFFPGDSMLGGAPPASETGRLYSPADAPAVNFAAVDWLTGWRETVHQAQAFVQQVQRSMAQFAWVETAVDGQSVGRTAVQWRGDVATAWQAGQDRQQAALHQRAVALAVDTRAAWVRVFLLAAQGAVILAAALGTPGGQLLALPAAVKFVRQVLAEVRQAQHRHALSAA
jgi:hypothetical protein